MEDPEEKLDEEILNGVALRPRVNSETDIEKTNIYLDLEQNIFSLKNYKLR